jgi:translation initiation factor IF-2
MAFDKDSKNIFLNYYNRILQEVVKSEEVTGTVTPLTPEQQAFKDRAKANGKNLNDNQVRIMYDSQLEMDKRNGTSFANPGKAAPAAPATNSKSSPIQGRPDPSTAAGQAAISQNQADIAAQTAANTKPTSTGIIARPDPSTAAGQAAIAQNQTSYPTAGSPAVVATPPPAPTGTPAPQQQTNTSDTKPIAMSGVPQTKEQQNAKFNQAKDLFKRQTGKDYTTMKDLSDNERQIFQGMLGSVNGISDDSGPYSSKTLDNIRQNSNAAIQAKTAAQKEEADYIGSQMSTTTAPSPTTAAPAAAAPAAPAAPAAAKPAANTSGYTQQQLDAFQKAHGTPFNPKSSMDRGKMAKMTGQAAVTSAMPGAGTKPGQVKTAPPTATATGGQFNPNAQIQRGVPANLPPGYVERQNSSLPGVLGTASNFLGRLGDTAKNVAMGTAGKVNPRPTAPPAAPQTQTKTTQAPKAKPTNTNQKVR